MYDQGSKLQEVKDLDDRRRRAADLAGLDQNNEETQEFIEGRSEIGNELMFALMVSQNQNRFNNMLSRQNLLWSYQRMLNKPFPDDEAAAEKAVSLRRKLSDECDKLSEKIDVDMNELFGDGKKFGEGKVRMMYSPEARLKKAKGIDQMA